MRGSWDWRSRWRLYAGVGAGLGALVATLVFVVPGGGGAREQLVAADPSSTPSAFPSSTETPTPTPTAPADEPSPTPTTTLPSPSSSAGRSVREVEVSQAGMLSDSFAEDAFGQGRRARVDVAARGTRVSHSCYDTDAYPPEVGPRHVPRRVAGRTWSWQGEVVATEVLLELESADAATNQVAECRLDPDPADQGYEPSPQDVSRPVPVGDGGFVSRVGRGGTTTMYAGARVGRFVVLVNWRQSGRHVPLDPLEHALEVAVVKATRGVELPARAAGAPVPLDAFTGYLTRDEVPGAAVPHEGLVWGSDVAVGRSEIACGPTTTSLPTKSEVHLRSWMTSTGPRLTDVDQVWLVFGRASEPASAAARFQECRAAFAAGADTQDESGLGDEAFSAVTDARHGDVLARSGDLYLWVHFANRDLDSSLALARAALTRYLAVASP